MEDEAGKKIILLTGWPGVGKTTLVRHVLAECREAGVRTAGFYTEEVRDADGKRVGFDVVRVDDDRRGPLARKGRGPTRVGAYAVNTGTVAELCSTALADLADIAGAETVLFLDEIGKMELCCPGFQDAVETALATGVVTLGTVPKSSVPAVDALRSRRDVAIVEVDATNRDRLKRDITATVLAHFEAAGPMGATGHTLRTLIVGDLASAAGTDYAGRSWWTLLDDVLDVRDFADRRQALEVHGLAVWDVHTQVHRPRENKIHRRDLRDFDAFAKAHPNLDAICFNGRAPFLAFVARYGSDASEDAAVRSRLAGRDIRLVQLPSSSPGCCNTALVSIDAKREAWATALRVASRCLRPLCR